MTTLSRHALHGARRTALGFVAVVAVLGLLGAANAHAEPQKSVAQFDILTTLSVPQSYTLTAHPWRGEWVLAFERPLATSLQKNIRKQLQGSALLFEPVFQDNASTLVLRSRSLNAKLVELGSEIHAGRVVLAIGTPREARFVRVHFYATECEATLPSFPEHPELDNALKGICTLDDGALEQLQIQAEIDRDRVALKQLTPFYLATQNALGAERLTELEAAHAKAPLRMRAETLWILAMHHAIRDELTQAIEHLEQVRTTAELSESRKALLHRAGLALFERILELQAKSAVDRVVFYGHYRDFAPLKQLSTKSLLTLAQDCREVGIPETAVDFYQELLTRDKDAPNLLLDLAQTYSEAGDQLRSQTTLSYLHEQHPKFPIPDTFE